MTNEKIFSDVKEFALVFVPINWIISFIISIVLYFTLGTEYALGYILGALTSYLTFGLLMKNTQNSYQIGQTTAKAKVMGSYGIRTLVTFIMLLIAYNNDKFNFFATIAGVLMLKLIMCGFVFYRHVFCKEKELIKNDTTI